MGGAPGLATRDTDALPTLSTRVPPDPRVALLGQAKEFCTGLILGPVLRRVQALPARGGQSDLGDAHFSQREGPQAVGQGSGELGRQGQRKDGALVPGKELAHRTVTGSSHGVTSRGWP